MSFVEAQKNGKQMNRREEVQRRVRRILDDYEP